MRILSTPCSRCIAQLNPTAWKVHSKLRHRGDLRIVTLRSLCLPAPQRCLRLRVAIMQFAFVSWRCTKTGLHAAAANLHLDRDAIDRQAKSIRRQRTSRAGFPLRLRWRWRRDRCKRTICTWTLPFLLCLLGQGFTHRRRRSRRKIAYELIVESYSACATRRSNWRRVSGNDEMNLSKREHFEIFVLVQTIANLRTIWENIQSAPELLRS